MTEEEISKLLTIEIDKIAEEKGLKTTDQLFEVAKNALSNLIDELADDKDRVSNAEIISVIKIMDWMFKRFLESPENQGN